MTNLLSIYPETGEIIKSFIAYNKSARWADLKPTDKQLIMAIFLDEVGHDTYCEIMLDPVVKSKIIKLLDAHSDPEIVELCGVDLQFHVFNTVNSGCSKVFELIFEQVLDEHLHSIELNNKRLIDFANAA